jgi:Tfp pilus assembly protein FimT
LPKSWEEGVRLIMLLAIAAVLVMPAAASFADTAPSLRAAQLTDISAAKKKSKKKARKEQYMRAVPSK